jgi:hypothetical protein
MPEAEEMALWRKTAQSGKEFLSGIVKVDGQDYKVVAFLNEDKEDGSKQPDYSFKKRQ